LAHPEHAQSISRVLAIPPKRFDRALISYLTGPEVEALLAACDQTTWTGRRDHAMLLLAVQTGLRISELIGLTRAGLHLGTGAHVVCHGKGRKDRATPLTTDTRAVLQNWLGDHFADPTAPLFPARHGQPLSPDAIERRSPTTSRSPNRVAPRCTTRRSPPTSCDTPPRCESSTPASTPASSPYGWAT
jgi:site-specific recombinase XerD